MANEYNIGHVVGPGVASGGNDGDYLAKTGSENYKTEWRTLPMLMSNVNYYVSTTGDDTNDGLTANTPLRTIMAAVNKVPKNMNGHNAIIHVADGTYQEDISILGFFSGTIIFDGDLNLIGRIKATGTASVNFLYNLNITYDPNLVWENVVAAGLGLITVMGVGPHILINGNCVLNGSDDAKSNNIYGIYARFGSIYTQLATSARSLTASGLYCCARVGGPANLVLGGTLNIDDCTIGLYSSFGTIYTLGSGYHNNNATTKLVTNGGIIVVGSSVNPS